MGLSGCDDLRDPSTPCGELQFGEAEPGAVVSRRRAPVLAMAGASAEPFVLHWVCETPDSPEEACTLTRTALEGIAQGRNAVLITSAGEYVLATDRNTQVLRTYSFDPRGRLRSEDEGKTLGGNLPVQLLASLRNSNWVVGIDADGEMVRYSPGEPSADPIAQTLRSPLIAAVGEQHIIGQVNHGNDDQSLYVVPVDEGLDYVHHEPTLLARGRAATRVVVGPRDEFVSVTYGHGDSAQTLVFRIPDGKLLDRFEGELVSGREDRVETVGLRAVSPDGSHLAYKTPAGSVALRDVESNSACLVRSASTNGETRVAGFSAEGKLYFESEFGPGETTVSVWDPQTRYFAVLSTPEDGARLAAVPSSTPDTALPWAIGIRSGTYMALADSEMPAYFDLQDAVFIPRDDPELWVFASDDLASGLRMNIRRVTARSMADHVLRYGELDAAPHEADGDMKNRLDVTLSGPQSACISTGTPGAPAYACGSGNDVRSFAAATSSTGTDPQSQSRDPEVPKLDENACELGGVLDNGACNGFIVGDCCYAQRIDGCLAQCGSDSCTAVGKRLECGTGVGFP